MELLLFFVAWVAFSYAFAYLLPIVIEGLYWAIAFAAYWLVEGLCRIAVWVWENRIELTYFIEDACNAAWRYIRARWLRIAPPLRNGAMLLFFFIYETFRPTPEEEFEDEDEDDDDGDKEDDDGTEDGYHADCTRLGLPETFTEEEFTKAYRRAIGAAHPDRGGNTEQAQAVNKARARIAARHGWQT